MGRIKPDWTSLPENILFLIAKRLDKQIDILRFRAVCNSFRSAIPSPPKLFPFPQSVLTSNEFFKGPDPESDDDLFVLVKTTVYTIQPLDEISSEPWLVYVEEHEPGNGVQLICSLFPNPLTEIPNSLNLLDYRVTEISQSFALVSPVFYEKKPLKMHPNNFFSRNEVIFSTSVDETDDEFTVMARFESKLSVWRNVDRKWSDVDISFVLYGDVVKITNHNHKFYALFSIGRTLTFDPKSLTVTEAVFKQHKRFIDRIDALEFRYVMTTLKDVLFLIIGYEDHDDLSENIHVFRLDERGYQWVPVVKSRELEDLSFFMNKDYDGFIYAVSGKEFSRRRGQCVYFIPNVFKPYLVLKFGRAGPFRL